MNIFTSLHVSRKFPIYFIFRFPLELRNPTVRRYSISLAAHKRPAVLDIEDNAPTGTEIRILFPKFGRLAVQNFTYLEDGLFKNCETSSEEIF